MPRGAIHHLALACALAVAHQAARAGPSVLEVEARIPLANVRGRIDHLAFDAARKHLFVAELGNGTVDVIDTAHRGVIHRMSGFDEPQGIAYSPDLELLYVASGGDGMLRAFRGGDFARVREVKAGADADNVRIDGDAARVYVGVGAGALAVFQASTLERLAAIPLQGHPESFQLGTGNPRIYINVPDAHHIAVVDRGSGREVGRWSAGSWDANYPMDFDPATRRVLVAFRHPAMLAAYDAVDGRRLTSAPSCGDADDVFVDERRGRIYVVCGEGVVAAFDLQNLAPLARVSTRNGARTGLLAPEVDRLYVAAPAQGSQDAEIWILAPR